MLLDFDFTRQFGRVGERFCYGDNHKLFDWEKLNAFLFQKYSNNLSF